MKHNITVSNETHNTKPQRDEIHKVYADLTDVREVSISQYADLISDGHIIAPFTYIERISNENWTSQSVFALDIDDINGEYIEPNTIINKFKEFGLTPNIFYWTHSAKPDEGIYKYRLVFFLDKVINDRNDRQRIMNALFTIAGVADSMCKNEATFFFDGTGVEVLNDEVINAACIVESSGCVVISNDSDKLRKINTDLEKYTVCYNTNIVDSKIHQPTILNNTGGSIDVDWYNEHTKIRSKCSSDIDTAIEKVHVVKAFASLEWMKHPVIFGLAQNLYWVNGGILWMKRKMEEFNKVNAGKVDENGTPIQYTRNNFNALRYITKKNKTAEGGYYQPQRLEDFSPFVERYYNVYNAIKPPKGYVHKFTETESKSLGVQQESFDEKMQQILNYSSGKYLVKTLPGMGKTEKMINLKGAVIAAPTNALKHEIAGRMNVPCVVTPDIPTFKDERYNTKLNQYWKTGFSTNAQKLIEEISRSCSDDADAASEYLENMRQAYKTTNTIITTHKRAMHTDFPHHETIVFDEDPRQHILNIEKVDWGDLMAVTSSISSEKIKNFIMKLFGLLNGDIIDMNFFNGSNFNTFIKKIEERDLKSNVLGLFNAKYAVRVKNEKNDVDGFYYIVKNDLPEYNKTIVMSASASEMIYKNMYPNIDISNFMNTKRVGNITQYTSMSCSRASLNYKDKNGIYGYQKLNKKLDNNDTITFKGYEDKIKGACDDIYIGNCEGYDKLKGKNLNIATTPHFNPVVYFLTAKVLGNGIINIADQMCSKQMVEYNGFRFRFNTYKNKMLREIQLSMIQGELMQAVGRARAIREDVQVKVYSNMPVNGAEFIYE